MSTVTNKLIVKLQIFTSSCSTFRKRQQIYVNLNADKSPIVLVRKKNIFLAFHKANGRCRNVKERFLIEKSRKWKNKFISDLTSLWMAVRSRRWINGLMSARSDQMDDDNLKAERVPCTIKDFWEIPVAMFGIHNKIISKTLLKHRNQKFLWQMLRHINTDAHITSRFIPTLIMKFNLTSAIHSLHSFVSVLAFFYFSHSSISNP